MERLTRKERTRTGKGVSKEPLIDRDFDRLSEYLINILTKLADYEDLEEQGRLIKLPCKVGDTVYAIGFNNNKPIIYESVVLRILITEKEIVFDVKVDEFGINSQLKQSMLGKTVFLTKSEAEAKLSEMKKNESEE